MKKDHFLQDMDMVTLRPFLAYSILYFLQKKEYWVIADILDTGDQSDRRNIIREVIDTISKLDSRRQFAERKNQLTLLWVFLQKNHPALYAEIVFGCCVMPILDQKYADYSESFEWKGFEVISEHADEPWVKDLFLHIIENVKLDNPNLNRIFTITTCYNLFKELNKNFKAKDSSTESLFSWYKLRVEKFTYLARTINFFMSIEHKKSILFELTGDEDYKLLQAYVSDKTYKGEAVEAIQEFNLFFSEILPDEFRKAIGKDNLFSQARANHWTCFHDGGDEALIAQLQAKQWFRRYHGIAELTLDA